LQRSGLSKRRCWRIKYSGRTTVWSGE